MKHIYLLVILICLKSNSVFSQWLNKSIETVKSELKDTRYYDLETDKTDASGFPMIVYKDKQNPSMKFGMIIFRKNICFKIEQNYDFKELNNIIKSMNNYVQTSEYSWTNYGKVNIYYQIFRYPSYVYLIQSTDKDIK